MGVGDAIHFPDGLRGATRGTDGEVHQHGIVTINGVVGVAFKIVRSEAAMGGANDAAVSQRQRDRKFNGIPCGHGDNVLPMFAGGGKFGCVTMCSD